MPLLVATLAACADPLLGEGAGRDITPPVLDVRAPLRGTTAGSGTSVEVRGFASDEGSGIEQATVNGAPVALGPDGAFAATVKLTPGITLIQTRVVDRENNERSETRAVLSGDLAPLESTVPDGIVLRLDRALLKVAGELAARKLDGIDLGAQVMNRNPLFNSGIHCLSARVEVTRLSKGAARLELVPVDGGFMLDASIDDLAAAAHVKYDVACKSGEGDIAFTATRFRLSGMVGLSLGADGRARLDASQTVAAFDGFDWGGDLVPSGVRDFFEEPLADTLAAILADELQTRLPELVADRLGGKEQVIRIGDQQLIVSLRPSQIRADAGGILVALDTRIYMDGSAGATYPRSPAARPDLDAAPRALGVAISDDAINQALSSLWGAGLLDRSQSVPTERFQKYGLDFNHVDVSARLPPVAEALPGGAGLRVSIGDVECRFELRQPGRAPLLAGQLAVSLRADFRASLAGDHLTLGAIQPRISIDVLPEKSQTGHSFNEDSLRALGDFVTEILANVVDDSLSDLPIPSIEGLRVVDADVASGPAAGGYLVVRGNVTVP